MEEPIPEDGALTKSSGHCLCSWKGNPLTATKFLVTITHSNSPPSCQKSEARRGFREASCSSNLAGNNTDLATVRERINSCKCVQGVNPYRDQWESVTPGCHGKRLRVEVGAVGNLAQGHFNCE